MQYSKIASESPPKKSESTYINVNSKPSSADDTTTRNSFSEEEEEITAKIPIETFCQINNASIIFDDPLALVRIALLKSKDEYTNYFGNSIYAIYIRTENDEAWFGIPVKNPTVGMIRWEKSKLNLIYSFILTLGMQEEK